MDSNLTNKQETIVNPILEKYGEVIIQHSITNTPWFTIFKTYNKRGNVFIYVFDFNRKIYRKIDMKISNVSKIIEF